MTRRAWDQFSEDLNFPEFLGAHKTYLIASTARSGSHYLANLLSQTEQLGRPLEYFNPSHLCRWQDVYGTQTPLDTLRQLILHRTSPNGWFGLKSHWSQFAPLAQDAAFLTALNIKQIVRITRQDRLAQAVSLAIARQSKAWISYQGQAGDVTYDAQQITVSLHEIAQENENWQSYLNAAGCPVIDVVYEQFIGDPAATLGHVAAAHAVDLRWEDIDLRVAPQRQSTDINAMWIARYEEEQGHDPALRGLV